MRAVLDIDVQLSGLMYPDGTAGIREILRLIEIISVHSLMRVIAAIAPTYRPG